MQVKVYETGVRIWLSANDTHRWANRPHASWPCSQLADRRVFAEFDSNGLLDMSIDGRCEDCDATEFNALVCDHLRERLPKDHPCYFVVVGQFV